jgi:hypothetical protein
MLTEKFFLLTSEKQKVDERNHIRAKRNIMRDIKLSLTDEVTASKEVDRTTNQCDRVFGLCSDFVCEFVCV